ncbi:hypothetical protein PPACK8108_LOCUS23846 [Phakopsora pachyrhizi]|uniref:Uncharacterized protein n=1 Tax=Phakopsora pachyrhizi TaxID=170000 RepID=A0AAV0BR51_PHAPC|nr:hypothetical protein PPACK8108_LOCUS23846 [Phakopsora pachyrhizi]
MSHLQGWEKFLGPEIIRGCREVGNGSVLAKSSNEKKMSNKDSGDQHNETDWPL